MTEALVIGDLNVDLSKLQVDGTDSFDSDNDGDETECATFQCGNSSNNNDTDGTIAAIVDKNSNSDLSSGKTDDIIANGDTFNDHDMFDHKTPGTDFTTEMCTLYIDNELVARTLMELSNDGLDEE